MASRWNNPSTLDLVYLVFLVCPVHLVDVVSLVRLVPSLRSRHEPYAIGHQLFAPHPPLKRKVISPEENGILYRQRVRLVHIVSTGSRKGIHEFDREPVPIASI